MSIEERDKQFVWHPYTQMLNAKRHIPIVKGEGAYLIDEEGNKYLDMVSSWWVNIHGHAHPYIAKKIAEQATQLEHVIFAGFTHPPAVNLAERLLKHLADNQEKVFYSDNGSTAVEVAIKMAFQYWYNKDKKRQKIIALENAYHGDTFGAMAVSGRSIFTAPFDDFLFEVEFVPCPVKGKEEAVLNLLKQSIVNKDVAAFIFEPLIQGAGGMIMYDAKVLDEMIALCKSHNVLAIADEVMTGFGRTGKLFASDHLRNQPDIMCFSKGITGGTMALGATTCANEVFEAFLSSDKTKTFFHGHSFTANPIACATALASLDLVEAEGFMGKLDQINRWHEEFATTLRNHVNVENIRLQGTILAFDLITEEETSYLNRKRDFIYDFFIERNILLRPLGNTIYLMPPYCVTNQQLKEVYIAITKLLRTLA